MKCSNCKLDIQNGSHCPLCGKFLNDSSDNVSNYPAYTKWKRYRQNVINSLLWFFVLAIVISVTVNLIISQTVSWSAYVIASTLLTILVVILPLKFNWSFAGFSAVCSFSIFAFLFFLDAFTGFAGWAINYAIPMFLLFMAVYSTIIIFSRNYIAPEFSIPLLILFILSTAMFVYALIAHNVLWTSLTAFAFCSTALIASLIFRFKRIKNAFEKSFFVQEDYN